VGSKKGKDKIDASSPFAKLAAMKKKMAAEEEAAKRAPPGTSAQRPAPRPAKPERAPRASEAEEALTFHRLMSGVVPLDATRTRVPRTEGGGPSGAAKRLAEGRAERAREEDAAHERLRTLAFGASRFEVTDDGQRVEGRRDEVTPDVMRKLRRGMIPIDARLDMHGMHVDEAKEALIAFLRDQRARSERCVLIIHGRGEHSAGPAVLRGEIAAWLSQSDAKEHVAAFTTAHDEDGGAGATYVLLRR
jgi:DNA-nicking Smr family endonuclease